MPVVPAVRQVTKLSISQDSFEGLFEVPEKVQRVVAPSFRRMVIVGLAVALAIPQAFMRMVLPTTKKSAGKVIVPTPLLEIVVSVVVFAQVPEAVCTNKDLVSYWRTPLKNVLILFDVLSCQISPFVTPVPAPAINLTWLPAADEPIITHVVVDAKSFMPSLPLDNHWARIVPFSSIKIAAPVAPDVRRMCRAVVEPLGGAMTSFELAPNEVFDCPT